MSEQIDEGGSAFPVHANHVVFNDEVVAAHEPGMRLRDWFAGQALAGLMADPNGSGDMDAITRHAYMLADRMLAARLTKPE